jgi:hypothetical protein
MKANLRVLNAKIITKATRIKLETFKGRISHPQAFQLALNLRSKQNKVWRRKITYFHFLRAKDTSCLELGGGAEMIRNRNFLTNFFNVGILWRRVKKIVDLPE